MTLSRTAFSPLSLLIVAALGFVFWIAADAAGSTRGAAFASSGLRGETDPADAPQPPLFVAFGQPPLHPGMPRVIAEQILASAGTPVGTADEKRAEYQVCLPRGSGPVSGWHHVAVEFENRVIANIQVSALSHHEPVSRLEH